MRFTENVVTCFGSKANSAKRFHCHGNPTRGFHTDSSQSQPSLDLQHDIFVLVNNMKSIEHIVTTFCSKAHCSVGQVIKHSSPSL